MSSQLGVAVVWCLVAALLFKLMSVWGDMPDRVAVHFGFKSEPNGWSSKRTFLWITILAVAGPAALSTWMLLHMYMVGPYFPWVQIGTTAVMVCIFWQVIRFNAEHVPFRMAWVLVPVILLMVLVGFYVSTARPRPKKLVGTRNVSYLTRMWRNYGVTGEGINTSPGQFERSN